MASATGEAERLQLVHDLLGTEVIDDASLDALTDIAASSCETPMSLLTLLDHDEQIFAARVGTALAGTARELAFCNHAIALPADARIFEVRDASEDPRFHDNDLVTGDLHLRFYAGVPLRPLGDVAVGTLCVLDTAPNTLTETQRSDLIRLAEVAEQLLRLRLVVASETEMRSKVELSERHYRYLAEHTADVVVVLDADLQRTFHSPNLPAFVGYTDQELAELPSTHRFFDITNVIDNATSLSAAYPAFSTRTVGYRKDGSNFPVSVDVLAIYAEGDAVEYRATFRDISGLVTYENQLESANRELKETARRRSQAVRTIAQDLGTPLAAIRITTESVKQQLPTSQLVTQVDNLVEYARHAEALVGDLRLVNDPDGGGPELALKMQPLGPLVDAAINHFAGRTDERSVRSVLDDVSAPVDEHAIARIVQNLLANSFGHNLPGVTVDIRLRASGDVVLLQISDDGVGIPDDQLSRVVEPYVSLRPESPGLGLAIANSLVAAHGGTLSISSNQPRGAVVTASFPR